MISWCPDYIYYLQVDGKILGEHIFRSEDDANEFALQNGIKNYFVIEWDVH